MGVFGTGLYSGDFAMDLRSTIGAVARLPYDVHRMRQILADTEPSAANDPNNEDHTTFWLVVADQFAKRSIADDVVRNKALAIIDTGEDIAMLEKLGMKDVDLRKRRKVLDEVRTHILEAPQSNKHRVVLKKPQPLLMGIGDVLIYPTCDGKNINPYYRSKELNVRYTKDGPLPWRQNGWGAMVIIDCGRAFEFLSWYRPLTIAPATSEEPSLDSLRGERPWKYRLPGNCSASHFRKMELKKIGRFEIDLTKRIFVFPMLRPGVSSAVKDISIANSMSAVSPVPLSEITKPGEATKGRSPIILGIDQILVPSEES